MSDAAASPSGVTTPFVVDPRGSGVRSSRPTHPLSPTTPPPPGSNNNPTAAVPALPTPPFLPASQGAAGTTTQPPAMRFLDVVRSVQQLQRREKLLKMQSNRTLISTGSASIENRNETNNNVTRGGRRGRRSAATTATSSSEAAVAWPAVSERSSLLHGGVGDGEGHSPKGGVGRIPSVIGTSATNAIIPEHHHHHRSNGGTTDNGDDKSILLQPVTACQAIWGMIFGKGWLSYLLLAAPLALWAVHAQWSDTYVFWLSFLVMIPLASILSDFTEEAALHTNDTIGGLLNASFGNAVEVVVAVQALLANEIRVVQASMLGSILSNLLLVLGCCFFFGGMYHSEQTFNATGATANMGLLALSSIALLLPTPYADYYVLHDEHVLKVSRIAAVFLLFMYGQLLVFQLKTHAHLFDNDSNNNDPRGGGTGAGADDDDDDTQFSPSPSDDHSTATSGGASGQRTEAPTLSLGASLLGLAGTTLLVALFSEYLVRSIDGFVDASGISRTFVGLILLPIVGNAVEHVSAVTVAIKDKMDLAMGVAVGSCTQISLLVVPFTVLVGWALDKPMTLNFPHFEIIMYIMSVLTVSIVLSNPRCNWLEGSLLITTYLLIAVGFWFEEVQNF